MFSIFFLLTSTWCQKSQPLLYSALRFNNIDISKIFNTIIVVLLYLILNLPPVLLEGSSTRSGVITNL